VITADRRSIPLQDVAPNAISIVTLGEQSAEIRRLP